MGALERRAGGANTRVVPLPRAILIASTSILAVSLGACGSRAVDATPTGAVRAFVEAMQRDDEPHAREQAYRLLCPSAQIALAERARSAGALGGRAFEPWEMIVEGRSVLLSPPRRSGAYRERPVQGEPHLRYVDVFDEAGVAHPIEVSRVDGSWCVELIPPVPEPG